MQDFLSKLENIFFDIFGLVLPGLLFLLLVFLPIYCLEFPDSYITSNSQINNTPFISLMYFTHKALVFLLKDKTTTLIVVLLLISFILGHIIKVISSFVYEFLTAVFDNIINKSFQRLYDKYSRKIWHWYRRKYNRSFDRTTFYRVFKSLKRPIQRYGLDIFSFGAKPYFAENELLKIYCQNAIDQRTGHQYPSNWYSVYKLSTVISNQDNVKSLSNFFLSKYNLYRSLSVTFLFCLFYYIIFFSETSILLPQALKNSKQFIYIFILLSWYTFHNKFKRYWTLCGNEALVSLYYFLHKKVINP